MKNTLLTLISITLVASCSSEVLTVEEVVTKDGLTYQDLETTPYTGEVVSYYPSGILLETDTYKDGKLIISELYHENGKLKNRVKHKGDENIEIVERFDETGKFVDKELTTWENGLPILLESYYENGKLATRVPLKDSKLDGVVENYYESGNLATKQTYIGGKREGFYGKYFDDGKESLSVKGTFKNGKRVGTFEHYRDDGTLLRKGTYRKGKKGRLWEGFRRDGTLRETWCEYEGECGKIPTR